MKLIYLTLIPFLVVTGGWALVVWIRRAQFTRERFAFAALAAILSLSGMLFASLGSGIMPWYLLLIVWENLFGGSPPVMAPSFGDYGFVLLAFVVAVVAILRLHHQWDGQKSVKQFEREERYGTSDFLVESIGELKRLIRRQPPEEPLAQRKYLPQPIQESQLVSRSWRDRAVELLKASSSAYSFTGDWLQDQRCWVGTNLETDIPVYLFAPQEDLPVLQRGRVADFLKRVDGARGEVEVIFAFKEVSVDKRVRINEQFPRARIETESSLLDLSLDFSDYRNEIKRRVAALTLPDSSLTLKQTYVSPDVLSSNSSSRLSLKEHLASWLSEKGKRQLALLGSYGQGKSTAALYFTYQMLFFEDSGGRIPLLIELRGMSPRNLTPLQLLGAWAAQYNLNPRSLLYLHFAGKLVLVFEGFDEMALVGDPETRLRHFYTLWQFNTPDSKIVITGRPNFFLDEEEMICALGIGTRDDNRAFCEALRLAPFTLDQISEALREQPQEVQVQVADLASRDRRFRELVARPSLLHIVSAMWIQEQLSERVSGLSTADLMGIFVRRSFSRQGLKEEGGEDFMALTTLEREFFMLGIAAFMASNGLQNHISGTQLHEVTSRLIDVIPESVSRKASRMAGEVATPLRERISDSENKAEHVRTDVRTCGLLVDDPANPGAFRFGHKSFLEYLLADLSSDLIGKKDSSRANAISRATGFRFRKLLGFPVALEFFSELIEPALGSQRSSAESKVDRVLEALLPLSFRGSRRMSAFFCFANDYSRYRDLSLFRRPGFLLRFVWMIVMLMMMFVSVVLVPPASDPGTVGEGDFPPGFESMRDPEGEANFQRFERLQESFGLDSLDDRWRRIASDLAFFGFFAMVLLPFIVARASGDSSIRLWYFLCKAMGIEAQALYNYSCGWLMRGVSIEEFEQWFDNFKLDNRDPVEDYQLQAPTPPPTPATAPDPASSSGGSDNASTTDAQSQSAPPPPPG